MVLRNLIPNCNNIPVANCKDTQPEQEILPSNSLFHLLVCVEPGNVMSMIHEVKIFR